MPIDKPIYQLNPAFKYALDSIEKTTNSFFITGRAGTGKSTLLRLFKDTTNKKTVVLAPTGIAALNVGGQTIHSFFGFPPHLISPKDISKRRNRKLYNKVEVLIIDEISMVRADMMDNIDYFLRINRNNNMPFGGAQIVCFGDLFQLPPIVSSTAEKTLFSTYYKSPYFFDAKVFEQGFALEMIELQQIYRQDNRHFIRLLDAVRSNRVDYDDIEDLNDRFMPQFEVEDFYITLAARNATVDAINKKALLKIPMPELTFMADIQGNFDPRLYPTEAILKLKLSAQVMFLKNDPDGEFVNGTIGKIVKLEENNITVLVEEGEKKKYIEVKKMSWEILKYKDIPKDPTGIATESLGSFTQYPLRLAWAVTIHKAQGKTFDKVIIDLGKGAFEHGQAYVALSRCRTLNGIVLKRPLRMQDVLVDERIVDFYEQHF